MYSFALCTALTNINIPESVADIGNNAFYLCNALDTITINKPKDSIAGAPWGAPNATVVWNN